MTASIAGAAYGACRSFVYAVPTGTGSAATSLPRGGYYLYANVDTWVTLGVVGVVATVPATRAPAAALPSLNKTFLVPAYQIVPMEADDGDTHFSVIGATAGFINFTGPVMGR